MIKGLLELFIKEPEREFYVREVAKMLKKSPTTISKYLKKAESEKIITSNKKLNHLLFKANADYIIFKLLKLNHNVNAILKSGLIDYLIEEFNQPETIILFGSFARAENNKNSDIDLLMISPKKYEPNLEKFEKKLGHKIQLFIHSKESLKKIKKTNKELFNNWIKGIILHGYFEATK